MIDVGTIIYSTVNNKYSLVVGFYPQKNHIFTRHVYHVVTGRLLASNIVDTHDREHLQAHIDHNNAHRREDMDIVVGNIYRKCVGKGDYIVLTNIDNLGKIRGSSTPYDFFKFSYLDVSTGVKGEIILLKKDFSLYFSALS